jgi:hypothetical protein
MLTREKGEFLVEVKSIKKFGSVLLTQKEYRKGRKRWLQKHGS